MQSTLFACKSADWPPKRRVETCTDNVSVGQEVDSDESVGSGAATTTLPCNALVRTLSVFHVLECWESGTSIALTKSRSAGDPSPPSTTHTAPSPIPLGTLGGGDGKGRWEGRLGSHLPCADGASSRPAGGQAAHDVKVTCCQEAHPNRDVTEEMRRAPNYCFML